MMSCTDYVMNRGELCPFCTGDESRETGERYHIPGKIGREIQCKDCGSRWWDIYELTAYEPVDLRDDPF